MQTIKVRLKTNPYNILISESSADFVAAFKKVFRAKNIFIVTDSNVAKIHLKSFSDILKKAGFQTSFAVIPAGESGKSIASLSSLYDKALKAGLDRKGCVIALGGGVVGDVAGFFAATYMRGVKFVQAPTTLLAMTDSSVGGKTAVNTSGGKNIAGTFYQPSFVWINSFYLATLDERQLKNGLAEVVKYAFTFDKNFYDYLQDVLEKGIIGADEFNYMIFKSCSYKARVVEKDEKEVTGVRAVLNFGHTLAHAIETFTKYKKFLHGEAVAAGMLYAAKLSLDLKLCGKETFLQVKELLTAAGFVFNFKNLNALKLLELMKKDKKSVNASLRFVLLKDIGKSISDAEVKDGAALKTLKEFLRENK
ncbi:3-dehydroquinate synthase [Endomicrobium proavitum]|uniref:3-dehydroquinate synthase n=1 Tax=Endomicrobium proavitum TaxID=1408281 RepID=A0A0G3WJR8_9BACT|nr:3-dehydroquinate synthase [Endomicrobium proavitum]AKL98533.1 3-dehydroquinate synthase [Endomicrobium proavitum]